MSLHRIAALGLLALLLATPAGAMRAQTDEAAPETTTRVIVGFEEARDLPPLGATEFAGARIVGRDEPLRALVVETRDPARLAADARVRYVEPDARVELLRVPNDDHFPEQYSLLQIGAHVAWDRTFGSIAVKVCVVDSGIRATHEDVVGRISASEIFGGTTLHDNANHGTSVATVAVGHINNNRGMAGVANAALLVAKAGDSTLSVSAVSNAIRWCVDQGAFVVSMSFGSRASHSYLADAISYAASRGAVLVGATGNDGCNGCVYYPARYSQVIAVGCTMPGRQLCPFSNAGPEVELVAPGFLSVAGRSTGDDDHAYVSGTSISAPHVSGAAALVKSMNLAWSAAQVRAHLQATARDLGSSGRDAYYGFGEVDLRHGLLDSLPVP